TAPRRARGPVLADCRAASGSPSYPDAGGRPPLAPCAWAATPRAAVSLRLSRARETPQRGARNLSVIVACRQSRWILAIRGYAVAVRWPWRTPRRTPGTAEARPGVRP